MVEATVVDALRQRDAGVRFDWGPSGAELLASDGCALVVVDTLSFTTAVSVATGRGTAVFPWPLADSGADELASRLDAGLAVPRRQLSAEHPWSLSPRSLLDAPFVARLVLPSPNGAAVATRFVGTGAAPALVAAACLRNASATSARLAERGFGSAERPVAVVAAGERWPDGTLRPAIEDLLGAGALVEALAHTGVRLSTEARVAAVVFSEIAASGRLAETIRDCASGRELSAMGFPAEAEIAGALDADGHASVLVDGAFRAT